MRCTKRANLWMVMLLSVNISLLTTLPKCSCLSLKSLLKTKNCSKLNIKQELKNNCLSWKDISLRIKLSWDLQSTWIWFSILRSKSRKNAKLWVMKIPTKISLMTTASSQSNHQMSPMKHPWIPLLSCEMLSEKRREVLASNLSAKNTWRVSSIGPTKLLPDDRVSKVKDFLHWY